MGGKLYRVFFCVQAIIFALMQFLVLRWRKRHAFMMTDAADAAGTDRPSSGDGEAKMASQFKRGDKVLSARSLICRNEVTRLAVIRREHNMTVPGEWYHVRELDGSRYIESAEALLCEVPA
jgi:hypothetical protein